MTKEYKLCACPLDCFDLCSMRAEIIDDRVTKLEGNKEHPITQGFICEKGRKHVERMYSPDRLRRPMKKVEGRFVETSWEDALNIIADKLKHYIEQFGTLAIAQYNDGGAGGLLKNVENLFFDYLGGVTLFKGSLCWAAGIAAQRKDFGDVRGHAPEDIFNAKTIILWGRNPAVTNIHLMSFVKKAKDRGAAVIVIDPIATATAAISDLHIQLKPGGDWAFACAAAKYILDQRLYHDDFIKNHTKGFDDLKSFLEHTSYEQLYEACGVLEETLKAFIEALLDKPSTIYVGYGVQRYYKGGAAVRCIDMLGALAGIIGIPGGGVNYANRVYRDFINWSAVAPKENPYHRYIVKPKLSLELNKLDNPKVKALFISRGNPVLQQPDSSKVVETLRSIEFKVVLDHFMTDTARLADIVLPVTYFMEENDVIFTSMWNGYMFYNTKLVPRYCETRPEYEIYSLLAEKLGMDFPQMKDVEWLDKLLERTPEIGLDAEELKRNSYAYASGIEPVAWAGCKFNTPSGRFEFIDAEELNGCLNSASDEDEYAFRLLTVHARESLHSQHLMTSQLERPVVYLCPADSVRLGIRDGEPVELQSRYGRLAANAIISGNCLEGVLYMKEGWWMKNGGSVNVLTPCGVSDIGDQAIYNECRCNIRKTGAANE